MSLSIPETSYQKQLSTMRYWLLGRKYHTALKAFEFAQTYHTGLRKDNVSPEFSHQMFIANYARTLTPGMLYPEETLAVILLHDVPEDYPQVTFSDIRSEFGGRIGDAVEIISKVRGGVRIPDDIYYAEMAKNAIASIAKPFDRAHNIFSMTAANWSIEKEENYLDQVFTLVLPMVKVARRIFTEQEEVYENAKALLKIQAKHIAINLEHRKAALERDPEPARMGM